MDEHEVTIVGGMAVCTCGLKGVSATDDGAGRVLKRKHRDRARSARHRAKVKAALVHG